NCGSCNKPCDGVKICQNGHCVCPSGRVTCGSTCCKPDESCCNGVCTNTNTDPKNCGSCGVDCAGGPCVNGQCTCPPGSPPCGDGCCYPNLPLCAPAPWHSDGLFCCTAGFPVACPPRPTVPDSPEGYCCRPGKV